MPETIRLATRDSLLALAQSRAIAAALQQAHPGLQVELLSVKTEGDLRLAEPLHEIGGKGLFTKEVDHALLTNTADLAVHSLKDLPTESVPGLCLAAVPRRASDDDVIAGCEGRTLDDLPQGATVATGSLRRKAQLLRIRPDLHLVPIRGNVDTRLQKARDNGWAGVVLAEAGLARLALEAVPRIPLPELLPAPGQGALGCVTRQDDTRVQTLLAALHDVESMQRVCAERAFLARLGAGCHAPVGARTFFMEDGRLRLAGAVFSPDGEDVCGAEISGDPQAGIAIGTRMAESILESGAGGILQRAEQHD